MTEHSDLHSDLYGDPYADPADDLDAELRRLADDLLVPAVPAAEDVARGRRQLRRQRLAVAGGALATLAVVGVGALALTQAAGSGTAPYAGGPTTPADLIASAPAQKPAQQPAQQPQSSTAPGQEKGLEQATLHTQDATLSAWNDVLAQHLDPGREHLQPRTADNWNIQGGGGTLGSKFTWTAAGQPGTGMLQVQVAPRWGALDLFCADPGWTCRDAQVPGSPRARVARHDGATTVAVQHRDGEAVLLTFDPLFGNNTQVAVTGTDVSEDALLAAAADERLHLPDAR